MNSYGFCLAPMMENPKHAYGFEVSTYVLPTVCQNTCGKNCAEKPYVLGRLTMMLRISTVGIWKKLHVGSRGLEFINCRRPCPTPLSSESL